MPQMGDSALSPCVVIAAAVWYPQHVHTAQGAWSLKMPADQPLGGFQVQVIPWVLADSNFVWSPSQRLDPSRTVFVGALHGMLNAEALAAILNDLFGGVVYAGIDTDKHKYPIGECPTSVWEALVPLGSRLRW